MSGDPSQLTSDTTVRSSVVPLESLLPSLSAGPTPSEGDSSHDLRPAHVRRRRIRRIAFAAGFITVAIATALVLIALALAQEEPRWWTAVDSANPRTIATAEAVENGITSALTQVRAPGSAPTPADSPDKPWTVFITNEQANAWLNVRLKRWLADQTEQGAIDFKWPHELREVQVSFAPGVIHIGARVMRPGGGAQPGIERPQTIAATLRPSFAADGSLWFTAQSVEIGRLPLPASWVIGRARPHKGDVAAELASQPQAQKVLSAFKGDRPVASRPTIKLADGRRVRLLAIEPAEGKLLLTCITEQHDPRPPREPARVKPPAR